MKNVINHQWFYPRSPETVWAFLTNADLLSMWLMKNDFKPELGHHFTFTSSPVPAADFDGNVFCEVLTMIPPKKLAYSWKCGPGPGNITLDSIVTWTLTPKDGGTELVLEHKGFMEEKNLSIHSIMDLGWKKLMSESLTKKMENATL